MSEWIEYGVKYPIAEMCTKGCDLLVQNCHFANYKTFWKLVLNSTDSFHFFLRPTFFVTKESKKQVQTSSKRTEVGEIEDPNKTSLLQNPTIYVAFWSKLV